MTVSRPVLLPRPRAAAIALTLWGAAALTVSLTGLGGVVGGVIAASFALLGLGAGLVLALGDTVRGALRLALLIGFGLAACTIIGQALILLGLFHPSAVIAIELAAVLVLLVLGRHRRIRGPRSRP